MAKDSIANDSIAPKKEVLDAIITHTAKDSIVEDVLGKKIRLYNEGHVQYGDIDLQAGFIEINYDTSIITAKGVKDSLGEYTQLPVFKQGREESVQDSLFYNFETEKAIIFHVQTTQSGIITLGEETKKVNDSTIYIRDIRFTTSEKKNPDYYLKTRKAKIVPNKKIVTGATNLVIADVPTPIALPFAYFPLTQDKASGFLLPTYSETRDQGFSLQNGGYYFAFSDYFDLALTGDIYSNGSWGLTANSSYRVRYKYNGRFSYAYENNIYGIQGFDDYSKSTNYNIRWNHSQDAKASPNSNFSASVNLGSSKYYRESLNENNSGDYLNNTLASSINYSKTFVGTPFNLSVGFNHSQNTNTEQINMSLPSLKVNMDRIYPFSPKSGSASNPIQKIGLTYGLKADNRVQTTDDEFFTEQMWQDMQSGVQQDISASTNMKAFKYWTISPSANYKEVWYFDYIDKNFDEDTEMVVTDTIQGFSSFREYNVGASLSTNIYGSFGKIGPLEAMRHTLRPSISYTYRPDFGYYYEEVPETADNTSYETYSQYDTGIYGAPSQGLSNSIGMSLNNTLEAKVKPKDSTETESRKITLLNNLNFSTSYNMAADSLKWSPTNVTAGTAFLQDKLRVNMGMTLDPYAINANGTKINVANINNGGSLFRITRANLTANYAFSSKDFDGDNAERNSSENLTDQGSGTEGLLGTNMSASRSPDINDDVGGTEKDKEKQEFFKNKIPWSLKVAYSLNYNNSVGQSEISSNSLMFSGDLEFTPKWLLGFSSGYDFKDNGVTYTQLRFSRDLDSWRINFNWVPFGDRTSYYFYIGVKSSMLSDLKYEKNSQPDQRLF